MLSLISAASAWAAGHAPVVRPRIIVHSGGFPTGAVIGIVIAAVVVLLLVIMLLSAGGGGMMRRRTVIHDEPPVVGRRTAVYEDEVV